MKHEQGKFRGLALVLADAGVEDQGGVVGNVLGRKHGVGRTAGDDAGRGQGADGVGGHGVFLWLGQRGWVLIRRELDNWVAVSKIAAPLGCVFSCFTDTTPRRFRQAGFPHTRSLPWLACKDVFSGFGLTSPPVLRLPLRSRCESNEPSAVPVQPAPATSA